MNILGRISVFVFYTIGVLLVAVPFFVAAIIAIVAYPFVAIYKDIVSSFKNNKC